MLFTYASVDRGVPYKTDQGRLDQPREQPIVGSFIRRADGAENSEQPFKVVIDRFVDNLRPQRRTSCNVPRTERLFPSVV